MMMMIMMMKLGKDSAWFQWLGNILTSAAKDDPKVDRSFSRQDSFFLPHARVGECLTHS